MNATRLFTASQSGGLQLLIPLAACIMIVCGGCDSSQEVSAQRSPDVFEAVVQGRVLTDDGRPVEGVGVRVFSYADACTGESVNEGAEQTGADGMYRLPVRRPEEATVRCVDVEVRALHANASFADTTVQRRVDLQLESSPVDTATVDVVVQPDGGS